MNEYKEKNKDIFSRTIPYRSTLGTKIKNRLHIFNIVRKDVGAIESTKRIISASTLKSFLFIKNKIRKTKNLKKIAKKIISLKTDTKDQIRFSKDARTKKTWMSPDSIAEYRKKIKIYDVFPFFNELDLLEIRLNILDPYVDYFVLVEATEDFLRFSQTFVLQRKQRTLQKMGKENHPLRHQ